MPPLGKVRERGPSRSNRLRGRYRPRREREHGHKPSGHLERRRFRDPGRTGMLSESTKPRTGGTGRTGLFLKALETELGGTSVAKAKKQLLEGMEHSGAAFSLPELKFIAEKSLEVFLTREFDQSAKRIRPILREILKLVSGQEAMRLLSRAIEEAAPQSRKRNRRTREKIKARLEKILREAIRGHRNTKTNPANMAKLKKLLGQLKQMLGEEITQLSDTASKKSQILKAVVGMLLSYTPTPMQLSAREPLASSIFRLNISFAQIEQTMLEAIFAAQRPVQSEAIQQQAIFDQEIARQTLQTGITQRAVVQAVVEALFRTTEIIKGMVEGQLRSSLEREDANAHSHVIRIEKTHIKLARFVEWLHEYRIWKQNVRNARYVNYLAFRSQGATSGLAA